MNWSDYKHHYSDFLASMFRAEIITFFADRQIPDTAVNQPASDKHQIPFFASRARRELARIGAGYRTDHGLMDPFAELMFDQQKERFLCYHELPLTMAYLEAFLGHSLTALWEHDRTLLSKASGYQVILTKRKLSINPSDWSTAEFDELVEAIRHEMFRRSLDGYYEYLKTIGIILSKSIHSLVVADLRRNVIIHNGGIVNARFLNSLNVQERSSGSYTLGSYLPIDYDYVTTIFNLALELAEELFIRISEDFLGIKTPLTNQEKVYTRQSLHMETNPAEPWAVQVIRQLGGADAYLAKRDELRAQGFTDQEITQTLMKFGKADG